MVVIKWFLLILLLSFQSFAQFDWFDKRQESFYIYTPVTGDATISEDMVQLFGSETRIKSNKADTLASKRSPQRWMVIVGEDSSQGLSKIVYDLPEDSLFSYYHSIFVYAVDGDTDYYKGDTETFRTALLSPSNLYVEGEFESGIIAIQFDINSTVASGHIIYRADSINGTYVALDTVSLLSSVFNDSTGISGRTYYYKVLSYKSNRYSDATYGSGKVKTAVLTFSPTVVNFGAVNHTDNTTPIYIEGFNRWGADAEENNTNEFTSVSEVDGNTTVVGDGYNLFGDYGFRSDFDGVDNADITYGEYVFGDLDSVWIRAYLRYGDGYAMTTSGGKVANLAIYDGTQAVVRLSSYGLGTGNPLAGFYFYGQGQTMSPASDGDYFSTVASPTDTLLCELFYKKDAVNGRIEIWVDGTKISEVAGVNTSAYTPDRLRVGGFATGGSTQAPSATSYVLFDNVRYDSVRIGSYANNLDTISTGIVLDTIQVTAYTGFAGIRVDSIVTNSIYLIDEVSDSLTKYDSLKFNVYLPLDTSGIFNSVASIYNSSILQTINILGYVYLPDTLAPATPTNVVATGGNRSAKLSWTDVAGSDAVMQYILWNTHSSALVIRDSVGSSETSYYSYDISGLDSGVVYDFAVICRDNSFNYSDTSAIDTARVVGVTVADIIPPLPLLSFTATGYADSIVITGVQPSTDVVSYTIMRSTENACCGNSIPHTLYDSVLVSEVLEGTTFRWVDYLVTQGSVYDYKIGNWDASHNGNYWSTLYDSALVPYASSTPSEGEESPTWVYVSLNGAGLMNGNGWLNAYPYSTFASVISPNDTVCIDGGVDSVVYTSAISIVDDNITILKGLSAGHNGRVISKATTKQSGNGITINEHSAIEISGIEFQDWYIGISVSSRTPNAVDSIYIHNNKFYCTLWGINADGGYNSSLHDTTGLNIQNLYIHNNYIEQPVSGTSVNQSDGISVKFTRNTFIVGNKFVNKDVDTDDIHNDFMEAQWNTNVYFFNNFFLTTNIITAGQNGVQIGYNTAGDFYFANNIAVKGTYTIENFVWSSIGRRWGIQRMIGNSFIGGNARITTSGAYERPKIYNNLTWATVYGTRSHFIYISTTATTGHFTSGQYYDVKNNSFYYHQSGTVLMTGNSPISADASNTWLQNTVGVPTLVNFDGTPTTYTTCPYSEDAQDYLITAGSTNELNSGIALTESDYPTSALAPTWFKAWDYIERDYNGVIRGASPDRGAFELGSIDSQSNYGGWIKPQ